jgi:diguanylate cyclase (GGDEF)-like protein
MTGTADASGPSPSGTALPAESFRAPSTAEIDTALTRSTAHTADPSEEIHTTLCEEPAVGIAHVDTTAARLPQDSDALPGGFVDRADLPTPVAEDELRPDVAPDPASHLAQPGRGQSTGAEQASIAELLEASSQANRDGAHHLGADLAEQALAHPGIAAADQATARQLLAGHSLRVGEFEASVRHGLLALEYFTGIGDQLAESTVHCTLALAFHETALEEPALSHVLGALEAARGSGSASAEFWALSRSSMVHQALGDADRSIQLGRSALALADTLDDPEAAFAAANNLGDACLEIARAQRVAGEDPSASLHEGLACTRMAVDRALDQGHAFYETIARTNLVGYLIEMGEYGEARLQAATAKIIATAHNYTNLAVNCDSQLAEIARAEGLYEEACAMMEAQLADPSVAEDAALKVKLHRQLYEMHSDAGRFREALAHHEELHVLMLELTRQTAGLQSRMLINSLGIEQARHEAERSRLEAEMQRIRAEEFDRQANTDPLTRLPNRRALDRQLPEMMGTALDRGEPLCAVMVDMDHFKDVNDIHGHAAGDKVLSTMATILGAAMRTTDLAVRVGGEEFLLVLGNTDIDQAVQICDRLLGEVRRHPWSELTEGLSCTASVGIALLARGESVSRWLGRADAALYEAKAEGRDRLHLAAARA